MPTGPQAPNSAVLMLIVFVMLLVTGGGLAYITYEHPALAEPIAVATGATALLVTAFGVLLGRE